MSDCIFCKIANGEIPSATLYEDEDFRVILDLGPASKGHALILPKAHAANIYEISDDMAAKAMILAKKMAAVTDMSMCDIPCRMTAPNLEVKKMEQARKDACFI